MRARESNRFWEVFDMTHKLLLTSITLFLPAKAVMPTNMCIIVFYFICLVLGNPYIRKGDDRFHLLVQARGYTHSSMLEM